MKQARKVKPGQGYAIVLLAIAWWCPASLAAAQPDPMTALASRSSVVVLGTVTRLAASEEPLLAPTRATAVIKIAKMLTGSEIVGDQTGHTATVILSKPEAIRIGTLAYFFGNPRFAGKTLTLADEGEIPVARAAAATVPPALAQGIQARRDAPLRERLAIATAVFRGTVENVRPLEGEVKGRPPGLRDEHDPEWQAATVKVVSALRGTRSDATVTVIFPNSRDIMWFNVPKPKPGEEWVFVAHRPQEDETRLMRNEGVLRFAEEQNAVVVSHPYDILPAREERRVSGLIKEVQ